MIATTPSDARRRTPEASPNKTKRLFCWSGGGLPGLDIHAGIWKALTELGITPTANAGTSAGAIMAAFCSAGIAQSDIERILRSLSDNEVRAERFAWKVRALWIDWFLDNAPIRAILAKLLPERWMDLRRPLSVVATRVRDGKQTVFSGPSSGVRCPSSDFVPLRDAVLASMSISGVFPHVDILGEDYADGGVRANLPLPANWREFDEIYLLIASRPVDYRPSGQRSEVRSQKSEDAPPERAAHGLLTRLMLNLDWYALDQIEDTCTLVQDEHKCLRGPRFHIIWPAIGREAGALRFRHEFIDVAYQQTIHQFKPESALSVERKA